MFILMTKYRCDSKLRSEFALNVLQTSNLELCKPGFKPIRKRVKGLGDKDTIPSATEAPFYGVKAVFQ